MWRCPKCGEECDENFDACWHCGTARDEEVPGSIAAGASDESPYRSPQNQDLPVSAPDESRDASPGSNRLTRQEIGSIACNVIGLWFMANGVMQLVMEVFSVGAMLLTRQSGDDRAGAFLVFLLLPLSDLAAGVLLWLNSAWLGEAIGGKDPTPVAEVDWGPQHLLAIAFAAVGANWLVVRLDDVVRHVLATMARPVGMAEIAEDREVFVPKLLGLAISVALILGSRKLATFVYRPAQREEPVDDEPA